ncbi:hypothetical protein DL767_003064 [Monosporascus sp. MG133]|nr:hypothetical protein DL767_003064 [Monosporascus sp. MG133]
MKRRSSGSAEDSAPACIETTRSREPSTLNDQRSTARRSPSSPNEQQYSSTRATSARNRTSTSNVDWRTTQDQNGFREKESSTGQPLAVTTSSEDDTIKEFNDFDTEHTRFASKYSLYLYREDGISYDGKISGIPVLFIPGNAGSYKQVRPIASEAANYFHNVLQHDTAATDAGIKNLDFFTVDFNEDFTAFDGQTMLDQAEYVNEAIRYILSLYLDPRLSDRDPDLPDPTSVIVLGHSMGGIVARTMLIMPNYQPDSINTIITMSAPHARPPVTFDPRIVQIYEDINRHWRDSYSQQWADNNPLRQVTLVSIAGGGLDTVVPSDYASLESIVPDTHGFTVFTSTIPNVWTSMDHQAITWCDQFRKVMTRALYEIVDIGRASQTRPRAERMRVFKKRFLTGLENVAEKTVTQKEPSTLLTFEDGSKPNIVPGERLTLRRLGIDEGPRTHLLTIPSGTSANAKSFTLLSSAELNSPGDEGPLEVLLCSAHPPEPGQAEITFTMDVDFPSDDANDGSVTKLICHNAASDVVLLPASTRTTANPFFVDGEMRTQPFSYLEYDLKGIAAYQYVAVVDKAGSRTSSWVVAEFSNRSASHSTSYIGLKQLLAFGLQLHLPSKRPMVTEIHIPSVESSLLAYNLEIEGQGCSQHDELFAPLVRQYLSEPYESKYFVNARNVEVSLHGISPYMPSPMKPKSSDRGISFQLWTDPTCGSSISIRLTVDPLASLGKLYMRYRTVFASFPILIVALVLRQQFRVYDTTGMFISFSESLDSCLRRSLPLLLLSLTLLSLTIGQLTMSPFSTLWPWGGITNTVDFGRNDLLTGTHDPLFWFLVPMIGLVCTGVCVALHYLALLLTYIFSLFYGHTFSLLSSLNSRARAFFLPSTWQDDRKSATSVGFTPSSPRRRLVTTGILLLLVSTVLPYQFAYVVACLIQLGTSVRAFWFARSVPSSSNVNFSNYVHSVFLLMFWVLPVNLPTLVVWVRNLAIHWFTPISCHHNLVSILPFVLLVETLTAGRMVPRVPGLLRHVTSSLLFGTAVYAAIYGVSYAYTIHSLVNAVAAWLVVVHSTADPWPLSGLTDLFDGGTLEDSKQRKKP